MELTLEEIHQNEPDTSCGTSAYHGVERRMTPRQIIATKAHVQPLDERLEPQAPPFQVVVRDVSHTGIGLIHTAPIEWKYLSISMDGEPGSRYLVRPVRCQACGPYYNIGARFVTDRELLHVALTGWRNAVDRLADLAAHLDDRPTFHDA